MNELRKRIIKHSISPILMIILWILLVLGWFVLFRDWGLLDKEGLLIFLGSIGVFTFILIFLVYSLIKNLKNTERYTDNVQRLTKDAPFSADFFENLGGLDIFIFKKIKANPILALPFLISIIAAPIISFAMLVIAYKSLNLNLLVVIYLISFTFFSIYTLGFIATGEILQRMLAKPKRNFISELVLDYLYGLPFVLIMSLFAPLFALVSSRRNKFRGVSSVSVWALFTIFKYYTYINLAMISFGDRGLRESLKKSFRLFKEGKLELFYIWVRSGISLFIPFLFLSTIVTWNLKYHFISTKTGLILWGIGFLVFVLWRLFSEQITILLYYIQTRHPECNLKKLG